MTTLPRPRKLPGFTYDLPCACGRIYVTCNEKEGKLFEIFVRLGKSGGCASAVNEGAARLASNSLRSGTDPETIVKSLAGISCHKATHQVPSCLDAISQAIQSHIRGEQ